MRILVTGGCGFVGSVLTPALLNAGHDVTVVDTMRFGNFLEPHPRTTTSRQAATTLASNLRLLAIADCARAQLPADVVITGSNEPRSYRLNSDKLVNTGFLPAHGVANAIREITAAVSPGRLVDEDRCYNVKWMKTVLA